MIERECPVVFATRPPGFHFFGYYDKQALDRPGRRLLTHHASFGSRRMPLAGDRVSVGYWSLDEGRFHRLAECRAFNWQQGAQLAWLPPDYESRIVFNDRDGDRLVARILDPADGSTRTLPFPVYAVAPDGRTGIGVNYERLFFVHPGYAYEGPGDPRWDGPLPEGDGLFHQDLRTGESRLLVSTREMTRYRPLGSMRGARHYLDHAMFAPDGERFCFVHRWNLPDGGTYTRLFSARRDGEDVRCLLDTGNVGHFCWRTPSEVVAWARPPSRLGAMRKSRTLSRWVLRPLLPLYRRMVTRTSPVRRRLTGETYLRLDVETGQVEPLAPGMRFPDDGHPTWSPRDPRWMLTDTYQDERFDRSLLLYDAERRELVRIGKFPSIPETCNTGFRCDLHPRWSLSGTRVCIDSTHRHGERHVYVIDVGDVVGS